MFDQKPVKLLPEFLNRELLTDPLGIVDVGCSGGISEIWNQYRPKLTAIGFDVLVAEVERLNSTAPLGTRYIDAFVGCRDYDSLFPQVERADPILTKNNHSYHRTSSWTARDYLKIDYTKDRFNSGEEVRLSENFVCLDEYFAQQELAHDVDFIKIDTDMHDYEVLLGARRLLQNPVLGLHVEVQLHGQQHEHANLFANIDRLLRLSGFTLFNLELNRHSRSDLPLPFVYEIAAQTHGGQVLWGEALYLRDIGDPLFEKKWPDIMLSKQKVLKSITLFEVFGLPDCAAEVLVKYSKIHDFRHTTGFLDLLTPMHRNQQLSYHQYLNVFRQDTKQFFPTQRATFDGVQKSNTLEANNARIIELEQQLEALRNSKSWRIMAPLRYLATRFRHSPTKP